MSILQTIPTTGALLTAIRAEVRGLVQGVGFRYITRGTARQLGVVGWVRNLPGGSVEVWAQGASNAIDRLQEFLEAGPTGALVESVAVEIVEPDPALTGFEVRF